MIRIYTQDEADRIQPDDTVSRVVPVTVDVPIDGSPSMAQQLPDGRWFSVRIEEDADVSAALAGYDPTSGTSPLVAIARPIARGHLDALLAAKGRG